MTFRLNRHVPLISILLLLVVAAVFGHHMVVHHGGTASCALVFCAFITSTFLLVTLIVFQPMFFPESSIISIELPEPFFKPPRFSISN
jgi:hypothetical protein